MVTVVFGLMTDNRNRKASVVHNQFESYDGNMGVIGCVSWSNDCEGVITATRTMIPLRMTRYNRIRN